jgi:peptide/nickel transport system substrate-binding protein
LRTSRLVLVAVVAFVLGGVAYLVWGNRKDSGQFSTDPAERGGTITATYRTEPASFNRHVGTTVAEDLVARLVHGTLVRLNRVTGELEPRVASAWTGSADHLTWTFTLRPDVVFSDGTPLTSADVVFSFQVLYDPAVRSSLATSLQIGGKPMVARAMDEHTVVVVFPSTFGPGIGILDALPILPAHKLRSALEAGTFRDTWGVTTPVRDIVGLGPFVIHEYVSGQRLVFARNERFWRRDDQGRPLPLLDRLELQFTPDQNAEVLRLQAGESDLMTDRVRVEDLTALRDLAARGQIALHDAGVSTAPDAFWFNLDPAADVARDRPWLQNTEFRRAASRAVNRSTLVNQVFLGEAVEIGGPITPGHGPWFLPDLPRPAFDPAAAKTQLAALGLVDRTGDGLLDDEQGRTAAFSVLTQKGHTVRERSAAVIKEHLRQVGLQVDIVALEPRAMIDLWTARTYDAMFFAIEFDSLDPGRHLGFWLSSGPFHFWHAQQASPSTPWEARLDALMTQQSTTADPAERRRLFAEAQRLFAEHEPVLYFAAPKVTIATSARVDGVSASVLAPSVLWNAETLYVHGPTTGARR